MGFVTVIDWGGLEKTLKILARRSSLSPTWLGPRVTALWKKAAISPSKEVVWWSHTAQLDEGWNKNGVEVYFIDQSEAQIKLAFSQD